MNRHTTIIACRDTQEAQAISKALGEPSTPVFHRANALLSHLDANPGAFIVTTPLLLDETAAGLLTKMAIIEPVYSVLYACHGRKALNMLRLFGCGCHAILGPDELGLLAPLMHPEQAIIDDLVIPPFFIDDDESSLKAPALDNAAPLHITFLGAQAMMSCANAMLNIEACPMISMAAVMPATPWICQRLAESINACTRWTSQTKTAITGGTLTLCANFNALTILEPTGTHFIICHGHLSENEAHFVERQGARARIFTATNEGYVERQKSTLNTFIPPEKLWDIMISALYQEAHDMA